MNADGSPATDIELRVWRQFLALAEALHFGRAAQALHMTQPPLTQAIQQLERRLGVLLFERTRRSVALTPAGAALVEPARQLLQQAAALPGRARDAAQGEVGRLRLGFVSTIAFGPLPGWLRAFREAQPGITIDLREATGDVQLEAFAQQELDAGFVLHAPGFALPPTLQRLSLGVEPLVIFPRAIAPSLYDAVLAFYHRHGVTPVIAQEAIQMQTIVNLVSAGLGLALVPQAMRSLQRPGIVYRALPAALADGAPRAETSLVWRPDAAPVVQRFVRFVEVHR